MKTKTYLLLAVLLAGVGQSPTWAGDTVGRGTGDDPLGVSFLDSPEVAEIAPTPEDYQKLIEDLNDLSQTIYVPDTSFYEQTLPGDKKALTDATKFFAEKFLELSSRVARFRVGYLLGVAKIEALKQAPYDGDLKNALSERIKGQKLAMIKLAQDHLWEIGQFAGMSKGDGFGIAGTFEFLARNCASVKCVNMIAESFQDYHAFFENLGNWQTNHKELVDRPSSFLKITAHSPQILRRAAVQYIDQLQKAGSKVAAFGSLLQSIPAKRIGSPVSGSGVRYRELYGAKYGKWGYSPVGRRIGPMCWDDAHFCQEISGLHVIGLDLVGIPVGLIGLGIPSVISIAGLVADVASAPVIAIQHSWNKGGSGEFNKDVDTSKDALIDNQSKLIESLVSSEVEKLNP